MNNRPIGIFDSGVGGLTVWKHLIDILPNESVIYLADSKNCPYGSLDSETVTILSKKNTEFLINQGCKIIVIACNTATAASIKELRSIYDIPFVGMEPAIKPAAINCKTGTIGILATQGTFQGTHYKNTLKKYANHINVCIQPGLGLVEQVESGMKNTDTIIKLLTKYLTPMEKSGADHIVLGCTHYPFLIPQIKKILKSSITIVDPAPAVVNHIKSILSKLKLHTSSDSYKYMFYTNGNIKMAKTLIKNFTNKQVQYKKT